MNIKLTRVFAFQRRQISPWGFNVHVMLKVNSRDAPKNIEHTLDVACIFLGKH